MSTSRVLHESSGSIRWGRWIAGVAGLAGVVCLTRLLLQEQVDLVVAYPASALFVGGTTLFVKLSLGPARWERTVNGPEARRFLAISLGVSCLLLLAGAILLVGWVFRSAR